VADPDRGKGSAEESIYDGPGGLHSGRGLGIFGRGDGLEKALAPGDLWRRANRTNRSSLIVERRARC